VFSAAQCRARSLQHRSFVGLLLLTCVASLRAPIATAHPPPEAVVPGAPEHRLARLVVNTRTIDDVMKRYGAPSATRLFTEQGYPVGGGEVEYTWMLQGAELRVWTGFYLMSGTRVETIAGIEVALTTGELSKPLKTGRGLRLGAPLSNAIRLYGKQPWRNVVNREPTALFAFSDESELYCTLDANDRIVRMRLNGPVE